MRPTIVSVSGFSSEVGKTTLLCRLLEQHPGWEAIKMTRGHYRSCGKVPEACCVSPMLGDKPLVFSGREFTYRDGKDTARYWDSGAANVHWVVGTDAQIEEGSKIALSRIAAEGVFVEGNSFLKYIEADYSIMVGSYAAKDIKSSAIRMMKRMDVLFLDAMEPDSADTLRLNSRLAAIQNGGVRIVSALHFADICAEIDHIHQARKDDPKVSPERIA